MAKQAVTRDDAELLEDFKDLIAEVSRRVLKESVDPTIVATVDALEATAAKLTRELGEKGKQATDSIKNQITRLQSDEAEFRDALQKVLRESNAVTLGHELQAQSETLKALVLKYEVVVLDLGNAVQNLRQELQNLHLANDKILETYSGLNANLQQIYAWITWLQAEINKHAETHANSIQGVAEALVRYEEDYKKWKGLIESKISDLAVRIDSRLTGEFADLRRWITIGIPAIGIMVFIIMMISCNR